MEQTPNQLSNSITHIIIYSIWFETSNHLNLIDSVFWSVVCLVMSILDPPELQIAKK